jgi:hypothetical protein
MKALRRSYLGPKLFTPEGTLRAAGLSVAGSIHNLQEISKEIQDAPKPAFKHVIPSAAKHPAMCMVPDTRPLTRGDSVERTTIMAIISFFPPRLTALGSVVDTTIRTSHGAAETILDNGGAGTIGNGRTRGVNACDHCGRRFGMVTYRWWGSKFCKKTCKAAFLRELRLGRGEICRWFGFHRGGLASGFSSTLASSSMASAQP